MFFKPITHSSLITTAEKQYAIPEILKTEGKPPRCRPPSPDSTETESSPEEAPSWRRSASFRNRQQDMSSEYISTLLLFLATTFLWTSGPTTTSSSNLFVTVEARRCSAPCDSLSRFHNC